MSKKTRGTDKNKAESVNTKEKKNKTASASSVIVKKTALTAGAAVIVGVMIAANIILSLYSPIINKAFAGSAGAPQTSEAVSAMGDELVREIGADSMVLLRNKETEGKGALPLAKDAKVNLFGWNSTDNGFMLTGGGSGGTVIPAEKRISLAKAMDLEVMDYNKELLAAYTNFNNSYDADLNSQADNRLVNPDASFYTDSLINQAKQYSDIAIVTISRFARENNGGGELLNVSADSNSQNYSNGTFLELTDNEKVMMDVVSKNFGTVIVLLNTTNVMECGFLEEYDVDAAFYVGLPGQSGARAIPKLLRGEISPSGRLADTYAYDHQTYDPTFANAIYDGSNINYAENIYFGYKWYETADAEGFFRDATRGSATGYDAVVQYPFGFGLSYTDFEWEVVEVPESTTLTETGEYTIKVKVTNVGNMAGKDVVQLYYTPQYYEGEVEKAYVNLLAFAKTDTLYPASEEAEDKPSSQIVTLTFSAYDMASYDAYDKNDNGWAGYELDVGKYEVKLMNNAHELNACDNNVIEFNVEGTKGDDDIWYLLDPDNEDSTVVFNRFTGSDAYAGVPIDGTTVNGSITEDTYLSRVNDFANFPNNRTGNSYDSNKIDTAANYRYSGYDSMTKPEQGSTATSYSIMLTESGGKPSSGDLDGSSGATLKYNEELINDLVNYDSKTWDALLNQLTVSEIRDLIGKGGFQTAAATSIGKPKNVDKDGPAGFNNGVTNPNTEASWTAYPVEALVGCSWNAEMMFNMGRAQGVEANETGVRGWYAPGVNLHRSPYNSRNYEYYSEDAVLSGQLAANLIRGAKTNNLYCYIKHFAVSEAGQNPNNKNTWLTEQALREIYLKPFEIAVKDGGSNGVMSCFNRIGAVWAGSNYALLNDVLRDEWGFRGTVITDWYDGSYMDYTRGVLAGNDLWLDGSTNQSANLDMNNTGVANAARLAAKNIIYTFIDTYHTAVNYVPGEDDAFATDVSTITAQEDIKSPLFISLWVIIDVVLAAGALTCVYFAFVHDIVRRKLAEGKAKKETGGIEQ